MKLLTQPGDGLSPIVQGINRAKSQVDIAIFRFDRPDIEKALANAVGRGVSVHALIAYTNRGGEKNLRKLEMRLLAAGVTVARTADDLARYHGKYLIVDGRVLYVLSFNFTTLDTEHSRSFGIITTNKKLVQEAAKLFDADSKRQPFTTADPNFIVSPVNARRQLAAFIKGARKQLLIYDPEVSDSGMIRLLDERSNAGVDVRVIGRSARKIARLQVRKMNPIRLHTRAIIRDGLHVFLGSQSLREIELNGRREVGIIVRDTKIAARIIKTFEEDWLAPAEVETVEPVTNEASAAKVAKKVAKAITKDMPPVAPFLEIVVEEMARNGTTVELDSKQVEGTVKEAVKEAVRDAVRDAMENAAEQTAATPAKAETPGK